MSKTLRDRRSRIDQKATTLVFDSFRKSSEILIGFGFGFGFVS